ANEFNCFIFLKTVLANLLLQIQSPRGVVFPEGYNFTIYEIHWIRQTPGKEQKPDQGLEWLVHYHKSSRNYYSPTIQGRFVASKDSSNFYLQMSNLKAEDAAVYYCVRSTVKEVLRDLMKKRLFL
uniref:Immunoglobulin V-set domain-containing protein n=1 Tax=Pseudonaja textilis TaxID=8673 RepID=A0A670YVI7_PSETE